MFDSHQVCDFCEAQATTECSHIRVGRSVVRIVPPQFLCELHAAAQDIEALELDEKFVVAAY